jgi:molecular chaperone DnaK
LRFDQIDVVLPVGGSSRIPLFRRALEYAWGRPLADLDDPDEAVAKGAAIIAGIEHKAFEEEQDKQKMLVLEVSPHRLGVATIKQVGSGQYVEDFFSEIIPKDAKLPAQARREYVTAFRGAGPIPVKVYEATTESNLCRDHHLVSELLLRNLTPVSEHEPVLVDFRYTLDGILDVTVQYVSVPSVRAEGKFTVLGGMHGGAASNGTGNADSALIAETREQLERQWRESPDADKCAPLLEQADRLSGEQTDAAQEVQAAADALKIALVNGDEEEVRRKWDNLTDLLFEMV